MPEITRYKLNGGELSDDSKNQECQANERL